MGLSKALAAALLLAAPAAAQDAGHPLRPALPPAKPIPPASDCDKVERRDAIVAGMMDVDAEMKAFAEPALAYPGQLMEWKAEELRRRKLWTDERRSAFFDEIFGGFDGFAKSSLANTESMSAVLKTLIVALKAQDAGDMAGACRATVQAWHDLETVGATLEEHWRIFEDGFAREEARLGVKLD
jgi:hypothetical protein